jgi:hypothetical protein
MSDDDSDDADSTYYNNCRRTNSTYQFAKYFKKKAKKADKEINDDNPHYVKWYTTKKCKNPYVDIEEFPNYEEACEFVRTELDDTDLYEECGSSCHWMIIDLFTLEITNYDICTFRMVSILQEEEEYKKEFALAIEKVLASKAFTLGLGLKLSMRNCVFELG